MKTGLSILLALLMTGVLMFAYWIHMPHRLWMKWKRTRQVRYCPTSEPPMAGPLPPLMIRPSRHGNAPRSANLQRCTARQPNIERRSSPHQ